MNQEMTLPADPVFLEEVNFPAALASELAGKVVTVEVLPEEPAYRGPVAVFMDFAGKSWRLPRRWLGGAPASSEPPLAFTYCVQNTIEFSEHLFLPPLDDLSEINLPHHEMFRVEGASTVVQVRIAPGKAVEVWWRDRCDNVWRIPPIWRRRRILLPSYEVLLSQQVPAHVATAFARRIVSVNYHPGSQCCLPEQYRFRDEDGGKYPVYIRDCVVVGFGDETEHFA
jgi:hypothetical protein